MGEEAKKQQLMDLGLNEGMAARAAQGMQRDEDDLAGKRRSITRAKGGANTRGLSPTDILRNAAQRAGQQANAAARDAQVSMAEGKDIIAELREIKNKLNLVN
jgi:hypothetical protein